MMNSWINIKNDNGTILTGKVKNVTRYGGICVEETTLARHCITLGEDGYTSISIIDDESDDYMELETDLRHAKAGRIMDKATKRIVASFKEIEQLGMPVGAREYCDMLTDMVVDTWDSE